MKKITIPKNYGSFEVDTSDPQNWKIIATKNLPPGYQLSTFLENIKIKGLDTPLEISLQEAKQSKIVTLRKYGVPSDKTCIPNEIELPWCFINHSCDPNSQEIFFDNGTKNSQDKEQKKYITTKNIAPGEEICYDYCIEQLEYLSPFECCCGSRNCRREIKGYSALTNAEKKEVMKNLTPFLMQNINNTTAL